MNLRQLQYFAKVVETENITKAAEALHVAQPALGLQIRQLEQELKVPLLIRHSRGVEPTAAGKLLYDRAREVIRQVDATKRDVQAFAGSVRETLRLGLTPSIMASIGPDLVISAREVLPDLQLILFEDMSFSLVGRVERDEIDIALAYDAEEKPALVRRLLLEEDLVLVTLPGQLTSREVPLLQALDRDLILPAPHDSVRKAVERMSRQVAISPLVVFEIQSIPAIKRMIARGLGATILPLGSVADEVERGELDAHRIVEPQVIRNLYLISPVQRPALRQEPPLVALVTDMLKRTASASRGLARVRLPSASL